METGAPLERAEVVLDDEAIGDQLVELGVEPLDGSGRASRCFWCSFTAAARASGRKLEEVAGR